MPFKIVPAVIILETYGGCLYNTLLIKDIVSSHKKYIGSGFISFVPDHAYSAGSIVSLYSDKLILTDNSKLSPIDPQILVASYMGIHTLPIARIGEFIGLDYNDYTPTLNDTISKYKYDQELHNTLFEHFISGKYKHNHIFNAKYLKEIGLKFRVKKTSESIEQVLNNYRENPMLCGTNTAIIHVIGAVAFVLLLIVLCIINKQLLMLTFESSVVYPYNLLCADIKKFMFG